MNRMKDKVVLLTGAAGGIGAASARLFASEGAHVALADIDEKGGEALRRLILDTGGQAEFTRTDVTDEASVRACVGAVLSRFGRLDALFNVAGGSSTADAPAPEVDLSILDATLALDLKGTFLMCRHAIPALIEGGGGAVVNTSSWSAFRSFRKHAYVAAKGGIISLTRSLAGEYAPKGIRVNVICPGGIRSARNLERFGPGAKRDPAQVAARERMLEQYPNFVGDPIDIANIALFLACEESRMITGAAIHADGGRSCF